MIRAVDGDQSHRQRRTCLTLITALLLCSAACGGRATLGDDSGRSYRQIWAAQANSRPAPPLPDMAAADAKTAMINHTARYRRGTGAKSGTSVMAGGASGRGGLTPSTADFGSGDSGASGRDRGISLEAR